MSTTASLLWVERAACRWTDPETFFPTSVVETAEAVARASAYCYTCPVWRDCLRYALDNNCRDGIWGGLTPGQREAWRHATGSPRRRRVSGSGVA